MLYHLGHSLQNTGASDEALAVLERCLQMREELFGADDLRTADVHSALGWVWGETSQTEPAMTHLVACARVRKLQLPSDHPDLLEINGDLIHLAMSMTRESQGTVIQMQRDED